MRIARLALVVVSFVAVGRPAWAHDTTRRTIEALNHVIGALDQAQDFILTSHPAGRTSASCAAAIEINFHSPCQQECRAIPDRDQARECERGCDAQREALQLDCDNRVQECQDDAKAIHLAALASFSEDNDGDGEPDGLFALASVIGDCGDEADAQHLDCDAQFSDDRDQRDLCHAEGNARFEACATAAENVGEDLGQTEVELYMNDADTCEAAQVENFGDECVLTPPRVVPEASLMQQSQGFDPGDPDFDQRADIVDRSLDRCADRGKEINQQKWTRRDLHDGEVARQDARIDQEIADRIADVDSEEARARAEERRLDGKIDQEVSDRIADVNAEEARARARENQIESDSIDRDSAERARATARENQIEADSIGRDNVLRADLSSEIARARAAEAALQANINAETARAQAAEANLQGQINSEVARAQAAEADLQNQINSESARAQAAEAQLQQNINAEAAARAAADQQLRNDLNAEASARAQADAAEAAARIAADAAEAQARALGDAQEAAARAAADAGLANSIANEAAARTAADVALQNSLNIEAATRAAADADLNNRKVDRTALDQVDCGGDSLVEGANADGTLRCKGPYQRQLFGFDNSGSGPTCPAGTAMIGVATNGDVQCGQVSGSGINALQNLNRDNQTSCSDSCSRGGLTVCNTEDFACDHHNVRCNDHQCNCHSSCWRTHRWRRWSRCRWSRWNCGNWCCGCRGQRCDTCHSHCSRFNRCTRASTSHSCGASCTTPVPVATCDHDARTALTWCINGRWAGGKSCTGNQLSHSCSDSSSCDTGYNRNQDSCCSVRGIGCTASGASEFVRALCVQAI